MSRTGGRFENDEEVPEELIKFLRFVKAESILELLEELGTIPEDVQARIMNEKNLETLTQWLRLAAKADSFEEFLNNM